MANIEDGRCPTLMILSRKRGDDVEDDVGFAIPCGVLYILTYCCYNSHN
jgi:hypothetical protein